MIREEFPSLYRMLYARVSATPDALFLRRKVDGAWIDTNWAEGYVIIQKVARALATLGFTPGTKVNILANTNLQWIVSDLAIMSAGGVTVPIYQSNTPGECQYIIDNCEARFIFAENAYQLDKLRKVRDELPRIEKVILFDGAGDGDWVLAWDEFLALARRRKPSWRNGARRSSPKMTPPMSTPPARPARPRAPC
jgi:long-chain acyl-CoA synthetase